jgi:thymidine phosphorylase
MKITIDEIDEVISAIHNKKKAEEIQDLLLDIRLKIEEGE